MGLFGAYFLLESVSIIERPHHPQMRSFPMKTTGNTILLSGGGSGIGLALARRWHDAGNVVIVTGRDAAKLEAAVTGRANLHAMPLDVTDPDAIAAFAKDVTARFPALNIL